MKGLVKHHQVAPFLNNGTKTAPAWIRLAKTTAITISMNPVTQEYDYAADESPSTELLQYKPSLNQPLAMHKGESDYEFVFKRFFEMNTGDDAKSEILLVFFQEKNTDGSYKAWKTDCVVSCNNLDAYGSTLDFDVLFGGTVKKGTVTIVDGIPIFSSEDEVFIAFTFTVHDTASTPVAGAIVTIGDISKTTNENGEVIFTLKSGTKHVYGAEKSTDKAYGTTGIVSVSNKTITVALG